jgi:hypothetical protein
MGRTEKNRVVSTRKRSGPGGRFDGVKKQKPVEALTKRGVIRIRNVAWTPQNYTKICQKVLVYWAKSYRAGGGNGPRSHHFSFGDGTGESK